MELVSFLCSLLGNSIPFVSYRLPDNPLPITLAGGFFSTDQRYANGDCFVIAPFRLDHNAPLQFYLPFFEVEGWSTEADFDGIIEEMSIPDFDGLKPMVADYATYNAQFDILMNKMQAGGVQKLVLSRIIEATLAERPNPSELFEKLCKSIRLLLFIFL